MMQDLQVLAEMEEECQRLLKLAHEAPLNPYRLDANGHRWVEQYSIAWAARGNEWVEACIKRDRFRDALRRRRSRALDDLAKLDGETL